MQYTVPLLYPCPYTNKTNKDGSASLLEYFFLGCGIERAHMYLYNSYYSMSVPNLLRKRADNISRWNYHLSYKMGFSGDRGFRFRGNDKILWVFSKLGITNFLRVIYSTVHAIHIGSHTSNYQLWGPVSSYLAENETSCSKLYKWLYSRIIEKKVLSPAHKL